MNLREFKATEASLGPTEASLGPTEASVEATEASVEATEACAPWGPIWALCGPYVRGRWVPRLNDSSLFLRIGFEFFHRWLPSFCCRVRNRATFFWCEDLQGPGVYSIWDVHMGRTLSSYSAG